MVKSKKLVLLLFLSFLVVAFLSGCGNHSTHSYKPRGPITVKETYKGTDPIMVACTTGMVAELVRNVGGKHVVVTQMMRGAVDPHLYRASPSDITSLQEADLIFYSGLHLEGKMTDLFENMAQKKPVFPVAEYYALEDVLQDEERALDPHVWFDVSLWNKARGVVQDVLIKFDPQHADDYRKQGEAYKAELDKLHEYARTQLQSVPKKQRVLITAHDAFRYFGKAYDIQVKGIQGISTEAEAGVGDIRELVDFLVENKIKAVFVETTINKKNMEALIDGCKARGHTVQIGGELFSDAMGPEGSEEGTYPGMVKHNVDTIVKALK